MAEAQPDKIKTNCSNCGAEYVVFSSLAGKQVQCVKCQTSFTVPPGGSAPAQQDAAASPSPAPSGRHPGNHTDYYVKWLATQMTEIVCPHCRLVYPVSKAYIGQYMACPRCRQKFLLSPQGHAMESGNPYERFLEDKAAVRAVVIAALVLVVTALIFVLAGASRKAHLVGTVQASYPAPNYIVTMADPPRSNIVHKVNDGSRECSTVAYVHIAHPKTGMEFNRILCRAGSSWSPTYYQRLLDESAARSLNRIESGNFDYGYDFNDMVDRMFDREASSRVEMYNRIPAAVDEEEMLKKSTIPAFSMLTKGNDWSDYYDSYYDNDDDDDYEYPGYNARYYLAHAVVYPDRAEELYKDGLIDEMP